MREFDFAATKVNALDEAERASTVQGRHLADYRDALSDELQRHGVVVSPAPLPKAGSPLALSGKMVRAQKKGSTAGETLIGVGEAVTDFAIGTFKLTTGLLGTHRGEETVDDTRKGIEQLPGQVKDTIDNWDMLSPKEKAYRATTAILMLRGACTELAGKLVTTGAPKTGGAASSAAARRRSRMKQGRIPRARYLRHHRRDDLHGRCRCRPGRAGDFLSGVPPPGQAYAKQLAKLGETTMRKSPSTCLESGGGAPQGNPVDNINIFEVPPSTLFIQR